MGNTRPHDKDNPPAFSYLQQKDGFDINIRQDYGDSFMPLPNTLLPFIPPAQSMHQEIPETGGRMIANFMMHNSLQNSRMDTISNDISSNQLRTCGASDVPFIDCNIRGAPHHSDQDYMSMAHYATNRAGFSSVQGQPTNRNFLLRRNAAGGYQMVRQAEEARNSNVNCPQTDRDFGSIGGNSYMMPYVQNNRQHQLGNHSNGDTCEVVKVSDNRLEVQERINGSFLSLGIGGNQTISTPEYSSQVTANMMGEAAQPSHLQQPKRTFPSIWKNLDTSTPSFHINPGELLNPVSNAQNGALFHDGFEVMGSANGEGGSSTFQVMQSPQYAMQQFMPTPGSRNLNSASNRNIGYKDSDYRTLQNNQPELSGALDGNLAGFRDCRQVIVPGSASEFSNSALIPCPTPLDMRNPYTLSAQRAAESAVNSPSLTLGGSSTRSNCADLKHGGSRAVQNSRIPQTVRVQPPAVSSLHPQKIGVSIATSGAAQGAASGLFPKRLGVDLNAQVAERDICSGEVGLEAAGKLYKPSDTRFSLLQNNHLTPPPIGLPESSTRFRYPAVLQGPAYVTGRSQDVPVHTSSGPPGLASTKVQVGPYATAHSRPSPKRKAIWSPPAPQLVQRQKIGSSAIVHPYKPHPPVAVPPIQQAASTTFSRIKWEGDDEPQEPTGEKCYICKRDVSFTAEGRVYQPEVRPAVAVLPCGHTFHDECLQKITPEDQCKEPPCIPCAIGEN